MKTETIGALLFRALGVVMFVFGAFTALSTAISYFSFVHTGALRDTYFVMSEFITWGGLLLLSGAIFLFFSKVFGRMLASGLQDT